MTCGDTEGLRDADGVSDQEGVGEGLRVRVERLGDSPEGVAVHVRVVAVAVQLRDEVRAGVREPLRLKVSVWLREWLAVWLGVKVCDGVKVPVTERLPLGVPGTERLAVPVHVAERDRV